ncbi:MAG: peptidylprolyl isomerase [Anaerolineaceae bacterium]|nr:peptidylprolyl isomerase [Anaerolineaceae bacterium]
MIRKIAFCLLALEMLFGFTACAGGTNTPVASATSPASPTLLLPTITPTLPPLAAIVNGEYILLSDFQAEMGRLKAAEEQLGQPLSDEERRQKVLDELIGQEILAQEAVHNGFELNAQELETRITQLSEEAGGKDVFATWMQANGYDAKTFPSLYKKAAAAAWQRNEILKALPEAVEQVHARQILVFSKALADKIYGQLQAGADFATLAFEYDPVTGGDLGWFPRGYLTQPDIETAAFSLQAGEYSQVIQTSFGFHLVQVLERADQRKLDPDAQQNYQHQALENWMREKRDGSKIEILAP